MKFSKNDIKLFLILLLAGFIIGPRLFAKQLIDTKDSLALTGQSLSSPKNATPERNDAFESVSLYAKSAFVFDIKTQAVLFSKDPDSKRPLASLTKIMTAVIAQETLSPDSSVRINDEDLKTEGFSGLELYEEWKMEDLLSFTLILSSNDGASALAASAGSRLLKGTGVHNDAINAFVSRMNKRSLDLGLSTLHFRNPTGLDEYDKPGGEGSARDVARLFEYVIKKHSNIMQYTALPEMSFLTKTRNLHVAKNTNEIASMTPGIIGGKTGFTDLAGGNLAVVVDVGVQKPLVIVVLGSTKDERFNDVTTLIDAARNSIK